MNGKEQRLLDFCRHKDVEGVWIRRRANVAWLTDGADVRVLWPSELGVASLLWTPSKKQVLTDVIEAPRLAAEEFGRDWEIVARPWTAPPDPPAGRFATDWPTDDLVELRAPLFEGELATVRDLGSECAEVVHGLAQEVQRGWSELGVEAELTRQLLRRAIRAPVVLIAADDRIARFRHPIATQRRIERCVMIVLCAQRRGLIVCLTRLVHFGPLDAALSERHRAVVAVDRALHAATRPGRPWKEVLAAGLAVYRETGFAKEWERHHQGGPMGYAARDFLVTPDESRQVEERQLVGWNPSIAGTKSEDTLLSDGQVLTAMHDWPLCDGRPDILVR